MAIRPTSSVEFSRIDMKMIDRSLRSNLRTENADTGLEEINLQEEMSSAAEEMADILKSFGRFSKAGRKNCISENDFVSSMLDDLVDEKLETLIRQVSRVHNLNDFMNYARQLFPDDNDLILALKEMLLSRRISNLQKKKIKETIAEFNKFADQQKMQSGINVSYIAKRFAGATGGRAIAAKELRDCYLNFLQLDIPAGFVYRDWISAYGFENRKLLLAFTLSALVADMKASQPGIQFSEFGPLSSKLSDARVLHTVDESLNDKFGRLPFRKQMRNNNISVSEEQVINLFMIGLVDVENLTPAFKIFSDDFMSRLLIKQRANVVQVFSNAYHQTPDFLFPDIVYRDMVLDMMSSLLFSLHKREKSSGVWKESYR